MSTSNKRLKVIFSAILVLLSIPFIAMQFTPEVDWNLFDFIVMGILLSGIGLTVDLVLRKVKSVPYRLVLCGLAVLSGFLVWAELAVGVFGSPFAGS